MGFIKIDYSNDPLLNKTPVEAPNAISRSGEVTAYGAIYIPADSTMTFYGSSLYGGPLTMEKNSRLSIISDKDTATLNISSASFEDGAMIVAKGENGADGKINSDDPWVKDNWWQAEPGHDGLIGLPGKNGSNGDNGIDLNITIGVKSIDGIVMIQSIGGAGGKGYKGGKGQLGGNKNAEIPGLEFIAIHHSGNGGPGGPGGVGGNGGNGGNIDFKYYYYDNSIINGFFKTISKPGPGNSGGEGGEGSSAGNNGKVEHNGTQGPNGKPGLRGKDGDGILIPKP